jgi:hypothetical protein
MYGRIRAKGERVRRTRLVLLLVMAAGLVLCSSASATPLSYTFDSSNQGWGQAQDPSTGTVVPAGFQASGGNPGGHLTAQDTGAETGCPSNNPCELLTFYSPVVTPLSANYGGVGSFDLRSGVGSPDSAAEIWLLAAGDNYLDGFLPSPTGASFNHFSIPLNESANWVVCPYSGGTCLRPSQQQFKDLIGATDQFAVMVDIAGRDPDGTGETYDLDNVTLTETAPTPVTPTPSNNKKKCKKKKRAASAKKCKKKKKHRGAASAALRD